MRNPSYAVLFALALCAVTGCSDDSTEASEDGGPSTGVIATTGTAVFNGKDTSNYVWPGADGVGTDATGACAQTLCDLMPTDFQCFMCIQEAGQQGGPCEVEYGACIADDQCVAYFMGAGGSIDNPNVQALGECVCTPGVCLDG